MIAESIKHISFTGKIWNSVVEGDSSNFYLDIRGLNDESEVVKLNLRSLKYDTKKVQHAKWTQLIGAKNDTLYFIEYQDEHDPNQNAYFSLSWRDGRKEPITKIPTFGHSIQYPSIYEHGTEYHKTVSEFLSLELPHSCEYLEWNDKIIISYYLRSGNVFDRYLLLLQNGEKEWKVCQDTGMKGFSPGAFFVFQGQLIFIKDQNEVCVYTG
ncbi:hypothetical protein [Ekhidna sp. To15]|uniref:hypothetical protein n=1 Tax=Ekhidna sp. To15 TaxID=3395267 RepID=UPI003F522581